MRMSRPLKDALIIMGGFLLIVAFVSTLVLFIEGIEHTNRQALLECLERTDDTEWCVEQFG